MATASAVAPALPDLEVVAKLMHRQYTVESKPQIPEETEQVLQAR